MKKTLGLNTAGIALLGSLFGLNLDAELQAQFAALLGAIGCLLNIWLAHRRAPTPLADNRQSGFASVGFALLLLAVGLAAVWGVGAARAALL